jgi:hypothetical protein
LLSAGGMRNQFGIFLKSSELLYLVLMEEKIYREKEVKRVLELDIAVLRI